MHIVKLIERSNYIICLLDTGMIECCGNVPDAIRSSFEYIDDVQDISLVTVPSGKAKGKHFVECVQVVLPDKNLNFVLGTSPRARLNTSARDLSDLRYEVPGSISNGVAVKTVRHRTYFNAICLLENHDVRVRYQGKWSDPLAYNIREIFLLDDVPMGLTCNGLLTKILPLDLKKHNIPDYLMEAT